MEGQDVYSDVVESKTDVPRSSQTDASQRFQKSSQMFFSKKQVILISIVMMTVAVFVVLSILFMALYFTTEGKSKLSVCRQVDLAENVNSTSHDDDETTRNPPVVHEGL